VLIFAQLDRDLDVVADHDALADLQGEDERGLVLM
jgi:hypothetical protein